MGQLLFAVFGAREVEGVVCCAKSVRNKGERVTMFYRGCRPAGRSAVVVLNSIKTGCCNSSESGVLGGTLEERGPAFLYVRNGRRVEP